jgi:hypothetical protein
MGLNVRIDNSTTHYQAYPGGYVKQNPVCGVADLADELQDKPHPGWTWTTTVHIDQVTCDFCKIAIAKDAETVTMGKVKEMVEGRDLALKLLNDQEFRVYFKQIVKEAIEEDAVETDQDNREWFETEFNRILNAREERKAEENRRRWEQEWSKPLLKPSLDLKPLATDIATDYNPSTSHYNFTYYQDKGSPWYKRIFGK